MLILIVAPHLLAGPSPSLAAGEAGLAAAPLRPEPGNRLTAELQHALDRVQPLLERYGYPALFGAVLVEGLGLVAPGQTLLIAASLEAARGGLQIAWVLLAAGAAAFLGNTLGYVIGRRGGRPLLRRLRVDESRLQRLEGYFARYGPALILLARFLDGLRQLNGLVSGLLRLPFKEFTVWNILGAVLWTGVWGLGTYFLEKEIAAAHLTVRQGEPWLLALSLLGLLAVVTYLLWPSRKQAG